MTTTLYVKANALQTYDSGTSTTVWQVNFFCPDSFYVPPAVQYYIAQGAQDPSATPYPMFPDEDTVIAYYSASAAATLKASINSALGGIVYTTTDVQRIDSPVKAALAAIDVSGKSSKANFTAVTNLAAHGVANASTASNPGLATNYNLISGVLGVANGLNDANAAQNDLATKYNDMVGKVNSVFSWLNTNKDKINAVIAAGAA